MTDGLLELAGRAIDVDSGREIDARIPQSERRSRLRRSCIHGAHFYQRSFEAPHFVYIHTLGEERGRSIA